MSLYQSHKTYENKKLIWKEARDPKYALEAWHKELCCYRLQHFNLADGENSEIFIEDLQILMLSQTSELDRGGAKHGVDFLKNFRVGSDCFGSHPADVDRAVTVLKRCAQ